MTPKILLVNPPIYDFTAYDFWLKPYGILSIAGYLRTQADFQLFDYLDRQHDFYKTHKTRKTSYNRGHFFSQPINKPAPLKNIPRRFSRYGLPRQLFIDKLKTTPPADYAIIQTTMTYWYLGIKETLEDLQKYTPNTKIIIGGNYPTLCPDHASNIGADLTIEGTDLTPLWQYLSLTPDLNQPALWEIYNDLKVGVIKITDGCPFNCSYCSVPTVYKKFTQRPTQRTHAELNLLLKLNTTDIAFYDDSLLHKFETILEPLLDEIIKRKIKTNLHTPNALNARFITPHIANKMVAAGFKTFYLGFESKSVKWQQQTGSKVSSDELSNAVKYLTQAGAKTKNITAYQIIGHPKSNLQELEDSIKFVHSLGIRSMLADFSPIPKTKDGQLCSKWINLEEPLMHNKTAFPIIMLGKEKVNKLKQLAKKLNRSIT